MANILDLPGAFYRPPFNPLGRPTTPTLPTVTPPELPGMPTSSAIPGGYVPPTVDYAGLLQSLFAPLQKEAAGFTAADKAALQAQQRRAVIAFGAPIDAAGEDLSLIGGGGFNKAINQKTLGLAQKNTAAGLSVLARLNEAHTDALRAIKNTLAARGLLRSGETGFQLGREQTGYTRSQYDARQKVLDFLGGIQAAFTQAEQQRKWALAMAAMQAGQSLPFYPPPFYPSDSGGPPPIVQPAQPSRPFPSQAVARFNPTGAFARGL